VVAWNVFSMIVQRCTFLLTASWRGLLVGDQGDLGVDGGLGTRLPAGQRPVHVLLIALSGLDDSVLDDLFDVESGGLERGVLEGGVAAVRHGDQVGDEVLAVGA